MMFACAPALLAFAFIPFVLAEGNLTGLLQALNSSGLDQFANVTGSLVGTIAGQEVLAELSKGHKTIFAPSDDALSGLLSSNLTNESLADVVAYHIVRGNFINETGAYPNETIGRTLLDNSSFVTLEGNHSQVLVWSKAENASLFVINHGSNITVVNSTSFNDTAILEIDSVLAAPPNLTAVLVDPIYNLTLVASFLHSTSLLNGSSVLDVLIAAHGITIFAPNNPAVQAAENSLGSLSTNETAVEDLLANHIINGTSVYSSEFPAKMPWISAGGQNYTFTVNSTGTFVSVGGSNQVQIVQTNVLTSNGVVHIINGIMLDVMADPVAASSAFVSATSVAAHSSTESGPVVAPTSAAMKKGAFHDWKMGVLGMVVGIGQLL